MMATAPLPFEPTSTDEFARLMGMIWADDSAPSEDGGMTLYASDWYDDWHDAHRVARQIGLRRTGGSRRDGEHGIIYRFANGDGVFVNVAGSRLDTRTLRFRQRKAA